MEAAQGMTLKGAARTAGITLLLMAALSIFANFFVMQGLVVAGDASATASNLAANETLYRLGSVVWPIVAVLDLVVALAFYVLFRPVNQPLSLLAGWFRLAYTAAWVAVMGNLLTAVQLVGGGGHLEALSTEQLNTQAMLSIETFQNGWLIALVLFGVHLGVLGYLAYRSGYVPKILGVLLVFAAVGYVLDTILKVLVPEFAATVAPVVMVPEFIGEMVFAVWLVIRAGRMPDAASASVA